MKLGFQAAFLAGLILLGGCASEPMGPRVAVLPAPNKPFDVFLQNQALCKQYAEQEVRGEADVARSAPPAARF